MSQRQRPFNGPPATFGGFQTQLRDIGNFSAWYRNVKEFGQTSSERGMQLAVQSLELPHGVDPVTEFGLKLSKETKRDEHGFTVTDKLAAENNKMKIKVIESYKTQCSALVGKMMASLSPMLTTRLQNHSTFSRMDRSIPKDILGLLRTLVMDSPQTGPIMERMKLELNEINQRTGESLESYNNRWLTASYFVVDLNGGYKVEHGTLFLRSLHPDCDEIKKNLINDSIAMNEVPSLMNQLIYYKEKSNLFFVNKDHENAAGAYDRGGNRRRSTFYNRGKKRQHERNDESEEEANGVDNSDKYKKKKFKPKFGSDEWKKTMTCFKCNKVGHVIKDCTS